MAKVAKVVLRHKSKYVDREYSYLATPETKLGAQVLVPFGKGNRPYEAVVTEMIEQEDAEDLKKIVRVVSDFTISPKKLELAKWIRDRYMSSFSEAINLFFSKAQEIQKLHETYLVTELSSEELEQKIASENKNSRNKLMLLQLLLEGEVNLSALQRELGKSLLQSARALEKENALIIEERRVHRVPMQTYQLEQKTSRSIIISSWSQSKLAKILPQQNRRCSTASLDREKRKSTSSSSKNAWRTKSKRLCSCPKFRSHHRRSHDSKIFLVIELEFFIPKSAMASAKTKMT